ncbi:MAG TPA: GGDEF domain-containing protein [Candidatus Acidoferrum sp.]|nr:GGDEF domain-containing protein [Candidatus Acidoferrum sp.]
MKADLKRFFNSIWSRPDPALAASGAAGELLVSKFRLITSCILLLIPLAYYLSVPVNWEEANIALALILGIFLFSLAFYFIARRFSPPWFTFLSSGLDATVISVSLSVFLFLHQPLVAVNSKVAFEGYFIALGCSSLRYDKRVCLSTGLVAMGQYSAIVLYAATRWNLFDPSFAGNSYGVFTWATEASRLILMAIACLLSVAIVSRSHNLLRLANTDILTGLYNRGYVDGRLRAELSSARRYHRNLSIAIVDVDHFKALNDTHGHAAGDRVLCSLSSALGSSFRQSDTVGRFGGEEFIVIMPETGRRAAHTKLESLRARIAATPVELCSSKQPVGVTISAGIASYPEDGDTEDVIFSLADQRLFRAKREGRNRVVAPPESVLPEPSAFLIP